MLALLLFLCCFSWELGSATDTITSSQHIKDPESIVSAGNKFKLGFFSPGNSTNRYVGILYSSSNPSVITPVWVANRNKPINDSSGIITISEDGNLVVLNGWKEILWSSNVSNGVHNSSAQLMDDGNLVLRGSENGNSLWESFQEPSDTYMEKMKLSANARTGKKTLLTSWTNPSDPSIGSFSAGIYPSSVPEFFIWKDSRPFWRSGPWNGQIFIGDPSMPSAYRSGFHLVDDGNGTSSLSFAFGDVCDPAYYFLTSDGNYKYICWDAGKLDWNNMWQIPGNECDVYGKCGAFGGCHAQRSPICRCLRGFEPKNPDEWNRGNWTNGCVRRRSLKCERNRSRGEWREEDGFQKLKMMKVPDFAEWSVSLSEQNCRDKCVNNCSCVAYAYYTGIGCMSWTGNLIDVMKFSFGGADLYIRLAHSELEKNKDIKVIIITVTIGAIVVAICAFFWGWRTAKYRERTEPYPILLDENMMRDNINQVNLQELPLFNLQNLRAATDNFDTANRLGQGGFGPVYKGILIDGQEIAVKRLSRASAQGLEEFMNEVVVISKLQHRNLVRLLGCCVEGEEKMLVYEYMPNKSLDAFLFGWSYGPNFNPVRKELLDWRKRFNIVDGICRGLLYLHRDSRLRIIHRDLKAGNILLDQELNPKISDFGMARIFGGNEDQANTRRVVGTYGYMAPEYAMEGQFSEKSDVFSFGVLLLEIICGRKNTSFYGNEQALSLLRFAWKLWNEGNNAALVDPVISNSSLQVEIFRCIHIGLLCVQEFPRDRPTIAVVISMLNSETVDLPTPKQPAFAERRSYIDTESSQHRQKTDSINTVTITLVGR